MLRKPILILVAALVAGFSTCASAETVIGTWSGDRSQSTPEFEVRAPWILDWRVTGDLSQVVAVDVSLMNAATGAHEGSVLQTKAAGNGVRLFDQSGRFYFRVDSTLMGWTLKVIQLTREEAEAYTPKSNHLLDR